MKAIWGKGLLKEKNINITFKYTLTPESDTVLELAASNLYRLFIDGELCGYGPARAAHGHSRIDLYALGNRAGKKTVIAIEVYSANVNSFYTVDELPFFAAEIKNGDTVVADTEDFIAYHMTGRVQKVRRFSWQRTFTESYRLNGNPKNFYASENADGCRVETEIVSGNKLLPRYVSYPALNLFRGKAIESGNVCYNADGKPWYDRAYYDVDNVSFKGFTPEEQEEDAAAEICMFNYSAQKPDFDGIIDEMKFRTYDFGRTVTGFFKLDVEALSDTTLYIIFDEVVEERDDGHKEISPFRNTCSNVIKYKLKKGEYNLIAFEANSARFSSVIVSEGAAKINDFGMVLYENPDAVKFTYDYKDKELNSIVAAAINCFSQNAVDILTDCPSRERAGFLCDSYFSSRAEKMFTGENRVEKSFLENYAMCPQLPGLPDGMIPMNYPADVNSGLHIPNWSMWYIIELNAYVSRTGDENMREISKNRVMALVKFFEKYENEDGLLEDLENWVFVEWSKCNDPDYVSGVNYPSNMLWAQALIAAAKLYDMPELKEKGLHMRDVIREQAWNGMFFEDNAVRGENGKLIKTGHTTETCQYYAFFFDIASRETHAELFERMLKEFGPNRDDEVCWPTVYRSNAFIGNYLRLEILLRYGYYEQVLQECRDFFLGMAELTGTLWEHAKVDCSLDHGFASVVAVYIDECVKRIKE